MATFLSRPVHSPFEQRRGEVERNRSMQGRLHRVAGFIDVAGAGEALLDVAFPVWFQERPAMSFGAELGANQVLEDGNFPTVSIVVKEWRKETRDLAEYFVGATLIVVSTGADAQRITAHWQAEGKALRNPLTQAGTSDDTI